MKIEKTDFCVLAVKFIYSQFKGGFYSTQTGALAVLAIVEYESRSSTTTSTQSSAKLLAVVRNQSAPLAGGDEF